MYLRNTHRRVTCLKSSVHFDAIVQLFVLFTCTRRRVVLVVHNEILYVTTDGLGRVPRKGSTVRRTEVQTGRVIVRCRIFIRRLKEVVFEENVGRSCH